MLDQRVEGAAVRGDRVLGAEARERQTFAAVLAAKDDAAANGRGRRGVAQHDAARPLIGGPSRRFAVYLGEQHHHPSQHS